MLGRPAGCTREPLQGLPDRTRCGRTRVGTLRGHTSPRISREFREPCESIVPERNVSAVPFDHTKGHAHYRERACRRFQLRRPHELHLHGWRWIVCHVAFPMPVLPNDPAHALGKACAACEGVMQPDVPAPLSLEVLLLPSDDAETDRTSLMQMEYWRHRPCAPWRPILPSSLRFQLYGRRNHDPDGE